LPNLARRLSRDTMGLDDVIRLNGDAMRFGNVMRLNDAIRLGNIMRLDNVVIQ
jgi:hypothetical protein